MARINKVGDLSPDYFDYVYAPGYEMPYPILSHYLGGLRKGELTMITSGSGAGKSVFCNNLVYDLIINKGLVIADIALEASQRKSIYRYASMYYDLPPRAFREDPTLLSQEQRKEFIEKFENLYIHDHFGSLQATKLLSTLEYYCYVACVDFIFLDHISIAVSGIESSREGERKDIDKLVTKIRELINNSGVGVICVSHLRNPTGDGQKWEEGRPVSRYDLRGSGSLAQVSDNIIAIECNLTTSGQKYKRTLKLLKAREGDEQEAYCDTFKYNNQTGKIYVTKEVL